MSGKHRKNGIKRDHSLIQGLEEALRPIAALPGVKTFIPGRQRNARTRNGPFLTVQAHTPDGLKLAAHGKGVIQEVFVVTSDRETVEKAVTVETRHHRNGTAE